jgi:hypothetical protein
VARDLQRKVAKREAHHMVLPVERFITTRWGDHFTGLGTGEHCGCPAAPLKPGCGQPGSLWMEHGKWAGHGDCAASPVPARAQQPAWWGRCEPMGCRRQLAACRGPHHLP